MSLHVNVNGTWKTVDSCHVNVSGTWKTCNQVYVNVSGTWKKCLLNTSTKTTTLASPLKQLNDYTVSLSSVQNGSTITITGKWAGSNYTDQFDRPYVDGAFGVGTKNATPITSYDFQAEIDHKWYWFPKNRIQTTTATAFTVKFKATSTSVTLYIRAATGTTVTDCKVAYIQEGYFD